MVGLGAMIGAGVFAVWAPAVRAAGNGVLFGLLLAAVIAYFNATSSAALAALYPESGGAYVYGRERLGRLWGFLAGWAFVAGKLASCAAMALTAASYLAPSFARPAAVASVVALTSLNYLGVKKSVLFTRVAVTLVLLVLGCAVAAVWLGGAADPGRLWPLHGATAYGVLQAGGLLFFAFAGYARLASLGEEVVEPARTIPRAIPIALGVTVAVYAVVAVSVLAGATPAALAASAAPLAAAVEAGNHASVLPLVRAGAGLASLSALLSLIVGVSRTLFAMSSRGDLPALFGRVHPRDKAPHRAELVVGMVVAVVVAIADIRGAIGFSSFTVLSYYAITNAAAFTLEPERRRWPKAYAVLGLGGCLVLAFTLPVVSVLAGSAVLLAGVGCGALRRSG